MPDLMSIGGADPDPTPQAAAPQTPSSAAGDPAVWTLLGEAGPDRNGQIAVGSTMVNRGRKAGSDIQSVVTDPDQGYEAWTDKKALARTQRDYPVGSDAYNAAAKTLADLQSGAIPVLPYTHFYGPKAQAALGRQQPSWSVGQTGTDIGGNRFYTLPNASLDLMSLGGAGDGSVVDAKTGEALNPAQTAYFDKRRQAGTIDPNAPGGTEKLPYVVRSPTDQPPANSYYVDLNGQLHAPPSKDPILATAGQLVQDFSNPGIVGMHAVGVDPFGRPIDPRARALESGFGSGVLLGGKNELTAGIESLPHLFDRPTLESLVSGQPTGYRTAFGQNLLRADRADAALQHDYPIAHGVGAVGGALGGAVGGDALVGAGLRGAGLTADAINNPLLRIGARTATRAIEGAAAGGAQGYLGGGLDDNGQETTGANRLTQGEFGAGAGAVLGVGAPVLSGAISKGAGLLKGLVEPFTERGQNNIVNRFIANRAAGGPTMADLTPYVKGSAPTLAQATGNPGLATLERGLNASNPMPFTARAMQNADARSTALDALRGDEQSLNDLVEARKAAADPLREEVFRGASPVDASPAVSTIDQILAGPSGKRDAVRTALSNIRSKLVNSVDIGTGVPVLQPETDPAQLYGVRQAIGDMLSARGSGTESDSRLATHELMQVRNALDPVIESGVPGFKNYLNTFAEASGPIESQKFLQGLNLTDSKGNVALGKVDLALKRIERMRAAPGANPAKSISDDAMTGLYNMRSDLQRAANSDLGRGSGSDTAQKLATTNLLANISNPAVAWGVGLASHHPLIGSAVSVARMALGSKDKELYDLLTSKLVNAPEGAMGLTSARTGNPLTGFLNQTGRYGTTLVPQARNLLLGAPSAPQPAVAH